MQPLLAEIISCGFGQGSTPINWFTSQTQRPDLLRSTWELVKGVLVEGQLPPTVKQMIAMTVSMQNNCRYCTVTHTGALESMGVSPEIIENCATDPDFSLVPLAQRAILKFALKAAREPNDVTDEDIACLRQNGLNDPEIMEVVMMAAFTNFINTWADVAGIALDGEADA